MENAEVLELLITCPSEVGHRSGMALSIRPLPWLVPTPAEARARNKMAIRGIDSVDDALGCSLWFVGSLDDEGAYGNELLQFRDIVCFRPRVQTVIGNPQLRMYTYSSIHRLKQRRYNPASRVKGLRSQ
jgi:hypothetical protein